MVYGKEKKIDYLAGSKPSHIIPDGTPLDEMAYYMIEDSERNFNEMMQDIGVFELNYFIENGKEVDYTAINEANGEAIKAKIKDYGDRMIAWLQKGWAAIQEAIQHTLDWFLDKAKDFKKKLTGISDQAMKDRVNLLKADANFGESYKFSNLDSYMSVDIKQYNSKASSIIDRYTGRMSLEGEKNKDKIADLSKQLDSDINDLVATVCKQKNTENDVSKIKKCIKNDIRGEKFNATGKWVQDNWDTILKSVKEYAKEKKTLKSTYNTIKDEYNTAISECKKDMKSDRHALTFEAFVAVNNATKKMLRVLTLAENATIDCLRERYIFYGGIVTRIAGSAASHAAANAAKRGAHSAKNAGQTVKSKVASKVKRESAVSTVDMLNSLFEW